MILVFRTHKMPFLQRRKRSTTRTYIPDVVRERLLLNLRYTNLLDTAGSTQSTWHVQELPTVSDHGEQLHRPNRNAGNSSEAPGHPSGWASRSILHGKPSPDEDRDHFARISVRGRRPVPVFCLGVQGLEVLLGSTPQGYQSDNCGHVGRTARGQFRLRSDAIPPCFGRRRTAGQARSPPECESKRLRLRRENLRGGCGRGQSTHSSFF